MFLILLLFASALGLEAIGSFISITGLAYTFAINPVIITMAATLDFSKIVAVSVLSKRWKSLNALAKLYLTIAALILMIITSAGIAGYLSNAFQKAILPNQDTSIQLRAIQQEQATLQARKQEIDNQIASLPKNQVYGRQRLMKSFAPEEDKINKRLDEITQEIPKLESTNVKQNTEVGPVMFLAEILKIPVTQAVTIIIGLVVFVFDPLSIMFLVTGNSLLNTREKEKKEADLEKKSLEQEEKLSLIPPAQQIDNKDLNSLLSTATSQAHRERYGCAKPVEPQEIFISRLYDPHFQLSVGQNANQIKESEAQNNFKNPSQEADQTPPEEKEEVHLISPRSEEWQSGQIESTTTPQNFQISSIEKETTMVQEAEDRLLVEKEPSQQKTELENAKDDVQNSPAERIEEKQNTTEEETSGVFVDATARGSNGENVKSDDKALEVLNEERFISPGADPVSHQVLPPSSPYEIKVEPKPVEIPDQPSNFIDEVASSHKDQLFNTIADLLKGPDGALSEEDKSKLNKALEPIVDRNKIRKSALLDPTLDLIAGTKIHNAPHEGPDSSILEIYKNDSFNKALVEKVRA